MTVTAVVRLMDGPLRRGELVGWVEPATTEERVPVRNAQELLDALEALAPAGDSPGRTG
jgi:hypothetical protein